MYLTHDAAPRTVAGSGRCSGVLPRHGRRSCSSRSSPQLTESPCVNLESTWNTTLGAICQQSPFVNLELLLLRLLPGQHDATMMGRAVDSAGTSQPRSTRRDIPSPPVADPGITTELARDHFFPQSCVFCSFGVQTKTNTAIRLIIMTINGDSSTTNYNDHYIRCSICCTRIHSIRYTHGVRYTV